MELGFGLYARMLTESNLRFARQVGATAIVVHMADYYPGLVPSDEFDADAKGWDVSAARNRPWTRENLQEIKTKIETQGLKLAALESLNPALWHDILLNGPEKDQQFEYLTQIIRLMGELNIPILGYHFTLAGVWGHVYGFWARGEARTVGYLGPDGPEESPIPNGMVWNRVYDPNAKGVQPKITLEELQSRHDEFLSRLLPIAQESGVTLAAHPDDPPVRWLRNSPRLMTQVNDLKAMLERHPSPSNKLQLCVGTLAEMANEDVYEAVANFAENQQIGYLHFRNVRGQVPNYHEVFLDEGDVNMIQILKILKSRNYHGVLIPDHTPHLSCQSSWHAGMAWIMGYIRAAIQTIDSQPLKEDLKEIAHAH